MVSLLITILLPLLAHLLQVHTNVIWGCGLFGFIGTNPKKYFSWDKFTVLGLYNDSRGGDACGRICGNIIQHGIGTLEDYKDFCASVPHPKVTDLPNVILGHCRKASIGGKNEIYAQPIVLLRKDVNMKAFKDTHLKGVIRDLPGDTVICSGIHNGTIENYKELAPKYGIPIEDHNDSKILLMALFYNNFDILSDYLGTAALVWQNHITRKTFVFRGASRYSTASVVESDERPLFYYAIGNENLYISSLDKPLRAIGATEKQVKEVALNVLTTFKDGVKVKETKIDRSKATQGKYDYSNSSKKTYAGFNRNEHVHGHYNDAYYNSQRDEARNQLAITWNPNIKKPATIPEGGKNPFVRYFDTFAEPFRIQAESCDAYNSKVVKRVVYNKTRYWMNGGLMHGIYLLNGIGLIPSKLTADSSILKPYCFVEGVLLDGITSYSKVIEMHEKFMANVTGDISEMCAVEQLFTREVVKHSRYPLASLTRLAGEQDCFDRMKSNAEDEEFYEGTYHPLFSDREYTFSNGDLVDIKTAKSNLRIAAHDVEDAKLSDMYLKTCRESLNKTDAFKIGMNLLHMGGTTNPFSPFQNILFGFTDINDDLEIRMLWIHYMRDFSNDVKTACTTCPCKDTTTTSICAVCRDCEVEIKKVTSEVNYAIQK